MTGFAGVVLLQALFGSLRLKERLVKCFLHLDAHSMFRHGVVLLTVVVQLMLGFRHLRSVERLQTDPLIKRLLGLAALPDTATISRVLAGGDARAISKVRKLLRRLVLDRLAELKPRTVTVDFDGSVQSTTGHAEGSAVGFNKQKKGARGYYPLFATVAQTGQFLDMHHRPGNVHDSNGASDFVQACLGEIQSELPGVQLECRFDGAFFDGAFLSEVDAASAEFSTSVPFRRLPELKAEVERSTSWRRINRAWSYVESDWRPRSWPHGFRVILFRSRNPVQRKGPLQLDLFEPRDYDFEYKVVVTNRRACHPRTVLHFHNGRGSQEKLIGEAKQDAAAGLVMGRRLCGNQLFTLAGLLAFNLARELQMRTRQPLRSTWPKRPPLWEFWSLGTLRERLLCLPGRLLHPQGYLTLRVAAVPQDVQSELQGALGALKRAA